MPRGARSGSDDGWGARMGYGPKSMGALFGRGSALVGRGVIVLEICRGGHGMVVGLGTTIACEELRLG
jgi:hypothetical protein